MNNMKKHDKLNRNSVEDLSHSDIIIGDEQEGPNEKEYNLAVPSVENLFALSMSTSNKMTISSRKMIKLQKVQLN